MRAKKAEEHAQALRRIKGKSADAGLHNISHARRGLDSAYGVPALAGRALLLIVALNI